ERRYVLEVLTECRFVDRVRWALRGKAAGSVDSPTIGATENAASRRPARPDDSRLHSVRASESRCPERAQVHRGIAGHPPPDEALDRRVGDDLLELGGLEQPVTAHRGVARGDAFGGTAREGARGE